MLLEAHEEDTLEHKSHAIIRVELELLLHAGKGRNDQKSAINYLVRIEEGKRRKSLDRDCVGESEFAKK